MSHSGSSLTSLGFSVPILQAPIGSAAGPALAAAVSEAGGLGALALTWASPSNARDLVQEVKRRTVNPFQVNYVLTFEVASLVAALEAGAPIITFSWGLPNAEVAVVRSYGAKFGVQVSTRDGAKRALDLGADFLICQGVEAGGHVQATQSLWKVLPEICEEAGPLSVIAAGGLATGRDIARALSCGAVAGMLGTRFLASAESLAHQAFKQMLLNAKSEDSTLTQCFDLGWPYALHRVLRNKTLNDWEAAGCPPSGRRPGEGDVVAVSSEGKQVMRYADTPPIAGMTGALDQLCLYAGTGCGQIHDVPAAGELVARLWKECCELRTPS